MPHLQATIQNRNTQLYLQTTYVLKVQMIDGEIKRTYIVLPMTGYQPEKPFITE